MVVYCFALLCVMWVLIFYFLSCAFFVKVHFLTYWWGVLSMNWHTHIACVTMCISWHAYTWHSSCPYIGFSCPTQLCAYAVLGSVQLGISLHHMSSMEPVNNSMICQFFWIFGTQKMYPLQIGIQYWVRFRDFSFIPGMVWTCLRVRLNSFLVRFLKYYDLQAWVLANCKETIGQACLQGTQSLTLPRYAVAMECNLIQCRKPLNSFHACSSNGTVHGFNCLASLTSVQWANWVLAILLL